MPLRSNPQGRFACAFYRHIFRQDAGFYKMNTMAYNAGLSHRAERAYNADMQAESRPCKEPAGAIAEHNEEFSYCLGGKWAMEKKSIGEMVSLICRAVALAMGVAVVKLSCLSKLELRSAVTMLGIGLSCAGLALLGKK